MSEDSTFSTLRQRAQTLADRSHVPFSKTPVGAVLLLDNGTWVPGVRVESASYSLTIPALLNAYTTAVAANRTDAIAAVALSRPLKPEEDLYLQQLPNGSYEKWADDLWIGSRGSGDGDLPKPKSLLSPVLDSAVDSAKEGIRAARQTAQHAYVPESEYHVGAILEVGDGRLVPGTNVEYPDWSRILCAERNALGTIQSYALPAPRRLFLSCNEDPHGTPCGACRQLLAELAPDTMLWMDRRDEPPERTNVSTLLPGSFRGRALLDEA